MSRNRLIGTPPQPQLAICLLLLTLSVVAVATKSAAAADHGGRAADLACGACRAVSRALHKGRQLLPPPPPPSSAAAPGANARRLLGDLVDGVCQNLAGHARMRHPEKPDRWGIVPLTRADGRPVDLQRLDADPGLGNWLRMRCEELLDDREAEVVKLLLGAGGGGDDSRLAVTARQLEVSLCGELSPAACSQEQLALEFLPPVDTAMEASGAQKLDLKFVKREL